MTLPFHSKRTECRLCGSPDLACVLSLTPTPPANALITESELGESQTSYPLDVYRCARCGHLQLLDVIDPEVMFRHYPYVSSTSPVMVKHLTEQAEAIARRAGLVPGDFVVEFGSNDGTLLRCFKRMGMRVLGVDPAANIAPDAADTPRITQFFSSRLGAQIREEYGPARVVCGFHVCAHIDDLAGVIEGVRSLLAPTGQFVFEVGYLLDVYQKTLFDTIYHEHLDYHHVEPLTGFFDKQRLKLLHVERSVIQGGALVGYVGLPGADADSSIEDFIALERAAGITQASTFLEWATSISGKREQLMRLLRGLKAQGKSIAAYGATAKATTLMHHFGLDSSVLDYVVDDNPLKQGLFTPGLHIPVLSPDHLYDDRPDYVLLLAWNFAKPILEKHKAYSEAGGRFIVPLPEVVVI